jgi:hypothetical protein
MQKIKLSCQNVFIGSATLLTIATLVGGTPSLTYWGIGLVAGAMTWMFGSLANLFGSAACGPAPGTTYLGPESFVAGFGFLGLNMLIIMAVILAGYMINAIWLSTEEVIAVAQISAFILGVCLGAVLGKWRME